MACHIALSEGAFDPWAKLAAFERERPRSGEYGATGVFVGTMRDFNEGDAVAGMFLDHYPGMTERHLSRIVDEATARWAVLDALVVHRVGDIAPGEPIVLVAVWSAHRKDAFEASRFIMEELKSKAPFWKRERLPDGSDRWVEKNTAGY